MMKEERKVFQLNNYESMLRHTLDRIDETDFEEYDSVLELIDELRADAGDLLAEYAMIREYAAKCRYTDREAKKAAAHYMKYILDMHNSLRRSIRQLMNVLKEIDPSEERMDLREKTLRPLCVTHSEAGWN